MREQTYTVQGEAVRIHVVEHESDLTRFKDFVRRHLRGLAVDSETTGLDIYAPTNRVRLVQFGNKTDAWVVPVEHGRPFEEAARRALLGLDQLVIQNASFDLAVFDRHLGIPQEQLWDKTVDTQILAKLIDPRARDKGGIGTSLEDLTDHYISTEIAAEVKGLMARLAKEHKTTKTKIWKLIDLAHPEYNLYAGMDCILVARLVGMLLPRIPHSARDLISFEHEVAEICSSMARTGFLVDVEYTRALSSRLSADEQRFTEIARSFGCDNVNSTEQVADVLEHRGVIINGRTPSGKRQVNSTLLDTLVAQGDQFAKAVKEAKRARKWRTTWVDTFLREMDVDSRCHASINTLQARTGRMSITGIPAQTLPAGDWIIRRCFIADEGQLIASVDYKAQELRVLAALARDQTMIRAFAEGADLHMMTARAAFGPEANDKQHRKIAKTVNFGRVYGGAAKMVHEATGISMDTAKSVVDAFDRRYPGVAAYSRQLAKVAAGQGYVTTPSGRRLPVDPSRSYAALNYVVQSTSRDVTCRGLVKLHRAGFTPYLRLPIHDEVVASLPSDRANWGADRIANLMAEQMGPVLVDTDPEVGSRSWGSLYGAEH
ncbi:DNA polymerase-1 [Actinokineospora baliensis]|uniref:DNA polymerase n=1 Tax=Actinokineospora baliensis TaxID=547056 RepID=UPI001EF78BEE|nr:DNA polymerase [Actinokineospora baliensis]MBM7771936.1 DNA polymerase-1 [Actinokineospora baliensis]